MNLLLQSKILNLKKMILAAIASSLLNIKHLKVLRTNGYSLNWMFYAQQDNN